MRRTVLRKIDLFRLCCVICCAWIISACIPATQPPQLFETPGAPVQVSDGVYANGRWSAEYPTDWRVITSAASAPVSVIFAAPDDPCTLILLAEGETVEAPQPANCTSATQTESQTVTLGAVTISGLVLAPVENFDAAQAVFADIIASLDTDS